MGEGFSPNGGSQSGLDIPGDGGKEELRMPPPRSPIKIGKHLLHLLLISITRS